MVLGERFSELIQPLITASDLELWDIENTHGVLRVLVDRPGGVDLDQVAKVAQLVSGVLDDYPEVAPEGRYQLEVSSPGIERTLRRPEHYRHEIGSVVSIKTTTRVDGARRLHGVLVDADEHGIRLRAEEDAAPTGKGPARGGKTKEVDLTAQSTDLTLTYDQIQQARTVLVWGPVPKPAQPDRDRRPARSEARAGRPAQPAASMKDNPA